MGSGTQADNTDGSQPAASRSPKNVSEVLTAGGPGPTRLVRKGTGPRTEQGKNRTKYNALKQGIFSKAVVLEGESRHDFDALLNGLCDDFQPEGTLEGILVEKLAMLLWRERRLIVADVS
jgi:hypothetical protein